LFLLLIARISSTSGLVNKVVAELT
jgi:hypothetical protein